MDPYSKLKLAQPLLRSADPIYHLSRYSSCKRPNSNVKGLGSVLKHGDLSLSNLSGRSGLNNLGLSYLTILLGLVDLALNGGLCLLKSVCSLLYFLHVLLLFFHAST